MLLQGDVARDYELVERLGSGSFGTVWKAWHRSANMFRAIKIANEAQLIDQFRAECWTVSTTPASSVSTIW